MMKVRIVGTVTLALLGAVLVGCGDKPKAGTGAGPGEKPSFSLAWSEYPSWSVFGVAAEKGLINGEKGKLGKIEEKWGVDIKLELLEYEPCINAYQAKSCDAVCITNMDVLNPSLSRKSVAVLPTSTSVGADACLVDETIKEVPDLKKTEVKGLKESVSQYVFVRCLEKRKEKEADYKFSNMDPGDAAKAMQSNVKDIHAIMVWNPFTLQTLKSRKDVKVLFDSSEIPEEVIDMVVIGEDVLSKPGGPEFACAIIDCYYEFNKMLQDPTQRDELLKALGKKFSSLDVEEMKKATEQTRFYKTPDAALTLFTGEPFPKTMKGVVDFYMDHKILKTAPTYGFGDATKAKDVNLRFDPTYIQKVKDKK